MKRHVEAVRYLLSSGLLSMTAWTAILSLLCGSVSARVAPSLVLADTSLLMSAGIRMIDLDAATGVSLAELTTGDEEKLLHLAHSSKKCGGFERLPAQPWLEWEEARTAGRAALLQLKQSTDRIEAEKFGPGIPSPVVDSRIRDALKQVREANLQETVTWLSSFQSRYHKGAQPNAHLAPFLERVQKILDLYPFAYRLEKITHQSTAQQSIRVRLSGSPLPEETVVLGAHLDSINSSWSETGAPGADDNGSGSANLIEALRILVDLKTQPEKTVDFYWYAGEEGGLLGSSEIAQEEAAAKKKIIAVLQLDMTLFPGDGEFVLGSMSDFTSPALRNWFKTLNQNYIGAKIIDDRCGYACSDHASWHRQGFPTLMPFEASFQRMFPDLHTVRDVIDHRSNFKHSAMFSKIAIAFAMELAKF